MKYLIGAMLLTAVIAAGAVVFTKKNTVPQLSATTPTETQVATNIITMDELGAHSTRDNCWIALDGKVYDVTTYIASGEHNPEIARGCGLDATAMYANVRKHQGMQAQELLPQLIIGTLQNDA